LLVDVRSASSYEKSHAVGAVSIPEETIASRLQELPRDKEIILYCT
jgi:rhodanese-related sulfurtransferase